jgi:hypothetical protein
MHCRPSERCHDSLTFSTCSWLDVAVVTDDNDTSTTQVRRDNDEPTGQLPLTPTCADGEKLCYTKHGLHGDTYAVVVCENGKFQVSMECGDFPCRFDERGSYCPDRLTTGLAVDSEATRKV